MPDIHLTAAPCESQACGRTDCFSCGQRASVVLRVGAVAGTWPAGILALAREVVRVWNSTSDDAVTVADLAWCYRARWLAHVADRQLAWHLSIAFAEGMTDALRSLGEADYDEPRERGSYRDGRALVAENKKFDL